MRLSTNNGTLRKMMCIVTRSCTIYIQYEVSRIYRCSRSMTMRTVCARCVNMCAMTLRYLSRSSCSARHRRSSIEKILKTLADVVAQQGFIFVSYFVRQNFMILTFLIIVKKLFLSCAIRSCHPRCM